MSVEAIRRRPELARLREPADAAARSRELVEHLAAPGAAARWLIHDLGCGTGAMGRWLAPLLPGPQRWVLHDRDADLLQSPRRPPGPPPTARRSRSRRGGPTSPGCGRDLAGAT